MVIQTEYFTSLMNLLDTYKIQARTEGKSPNTLRIYATAVSILEKFLERNGYSTDIIEINPEEIREFIENSTEYPPAS